MRLGHRRQQHEEAQVDLTSMLDIVFIMLIFFIVTSSFVRESGMEVQRPQASNAIAQANAGIFIAVDAQNRIYIDQRVIDVERVQANLEHLLLEQPSAKLVIQADKHAYNGTVVKVMDGAKAAGIQDIALATESP
jgi:biopolymer transport protein ExbD